MTDNDKGPSGVTPETDLDTVEELFDYMKSGGVPEVGEPEEEEQRQSTHKTPGGYNHE